MKKLVFASFLLAGVFSANAQTISLTNAIPASSTTLGAGTSVRVGTLAGNALSSAASQNPTAQSTFVGNNAGRLNANGTDNTFIGWGAGDLNNGALVSPGNWSASYNTFIGRSAGGFNTTGGNNTFLGSLTGLVNTTGSGNVYLGFGAGGNNQTGGRNVMAGWCAGPSTQTQPITNTWSNTVFGYTAGNQLTGGNNVLIGDSAGFKAGNNNVMIGKASGYYETGDNKLYIANTDTTTPLVWGDFAASQLKLNGKVGIGNVTTYPTNALYANYKLFVTGGILTDEVRVALSSAGTWADYVFAKDYDLKSISEVEKFIDENGHLPNVPSAAQVKEEGINVADMARIQQEKIEELMLYIIQQNKRIEALETKLNGK